MDQEIFIDVRTDKEWAEGHLEGALHFDLALLLRGQSPDLKKDSQIALYCRAGHRAGLALKILQEHGFTSARNAGGFDTLMKISKESK